MHLHRSDSDKDGLSDVYERLYAQPGADLSPLGDEDQDGLTNLEEYQHHCSPVNADTDGGGEADGSEVARGADPLDPSDDTANVFVPLVAPGNAKVLVAMHVPATLGASVELQRAVSRRGPFESRYAGPLPERAVLADESPNRVLSCYRLRTTSAGVTSDWSSPYCVTPAVDPLPPTVSLALASGAVRPGAEQITMRLSASDEPGGLNLTSIGALPLSSGGSIGMLELEEPSSAFSAGPAPQPLVDAEIEPSGVSEMLVSLRADFADTSWQPYEPELTLSLPAELPCTVYVKVRDGAGNESRTETLSVVTQDDWPRQTLLATTSIVLGRGSVAKGPVIVSEQASEDDQEHDPEHKSEDDSDHRAELLLEPGATIEGNAFANRVKLLHTAELRGDAYTNALTGKGALTGVLHAPLALPMPVRLPDLPSAAPSELAVRVGRGEERVLQPGSYGSVRLESGKREHPTRLTLVGGSYTFASLELGERARLECLGQCELVVVAGLRAGSSAYFGASAESVRPAGAYPALEVVVLGDGMHPGHGEHVQGHCSGGDNEHGSHDGADREHACFKGAWLGERSEFRGRLWAPEGDIWLEAKASVRGTLVAERIRLGAGATAQP